MRQRLVFLLIIVSIGVFGVAGGVRATQEASPAASPAAGLEALSGIIVIDGSSTVYPIMDEAAIRFMDQAEDVRMSVAFSGTGDGFRKFCDGDLDIQDASRPIDAEEMARCASNGIAYYVFEIAYDGITVVVNPENDFVDCLTVEQLERLWRAEDNADTWADLDPAWPDEEIDLYGPGPASGTFDYFTEVILGADGASRTDYFPSEDDGRLVLGVAEDEHGLAYFGFGNYLVSQDELRAVPIDSGAGCVAPTPESIADGSYGPLARPLYIYVDAAELGRPELQAFVRFFLTDAAQIVTDAGYVPAPAAVYEADLMELDAAIAGDLAPHGPTGD